MSFFKRVADGFDGAIKTAVAKSKDISGIAKLNGEIVKYKAQIENEYSEIGENAYKAFSEDAEDTNMAESLEKIKDLLDQIDVKKDEILILKGITICPECGEELDMVCAFCGKCGLKIERDDE